MRPSPKFLPVALVASLGLAACGSSSYGSASSSSATTATSSTQASSSSAPSGGPTTVKTASNATLGATVLTDAQGMTLYSLSGERNGKFICASSACVGVWHPLSPIGGAAPSGVGSLATVRRSDGTEQVTYEGMPLYTFAQDARPGDAKGQGLKDVGTWTAVRSGEGGAPPAQAATQTQSAPPAPARSGGRYGY
jgi:predicted lipoprotein with Yx(FWY)xxD motif